MLALCWCRFAEDQDRDYCPDFLGLSDSDLAALGKEYGSFLPSWGEKSKFLAAYEEIIHYCDEEYDEPILAASKSTPSASSWTTSKLRWGQECWGD